MKIAVRNYAAVEAADIDAEPIAFLCGQNHAGKSSITAATAAALTGATLPAGLQKSSAGVLVRGGAAQGSCSIAFPAGGNVHVTWPKADRRVEGTVPLISLFATGQLSILDMDRRDRASALANYLKETVPIKADLTAAAAAERLPPELVDMVWSKIATEGWDTAWNHCKDRTLKLKGKWEQVTGERYGSDKAGRWLPAGWTVDLEGVSRESLESALAGVQADHDAIIADEGGRAERRRTLEAKINAARGIDTAALRTRVIEAERVSAEARAALESAIAEDAVRKEQEKPTLPPAKSYEQQTITITKGGGIEGAQQVIPPATPLPRQAPLPEPNALHPVIGKAHCPACKIVLRIENRGGHYGLASFPGDAL